MNTIIWIIQGVLAIMFLMAGYMKSTQPKEKLVMSLPWASDFNIQTIRFIGISELLGAIGIVVPQYTGIFPILTPIAATGLVLVMILAALHHLRKDKYKGVAFNVVLLILLAIVSIYRFLM
jgi:uncharacterized membrane protein YphA (DoxX/SURF4 family)